MMRRWSKNCCFIHPVSFCLFIAVTCLVSNASEGYGQVDSITRNLSQLTVDWHADQAGTWIITDSNQRNCARGRQVPGANHIAIDKIANAEDLRIVFTPTQGETSAVSIPGQPLLSNLSKPAGSSVIYQLPIRTYFARGLGRSLSGTMNDLSDERLQSLRELGVDYLWLTGIVEHADLRQTDPDVVKGDAGSYYAVYDNWDVAGELGNLSDFSALIERAHNHQLRVLIDLVPNHTARFHRTDIACKQDIDFGKNDHRDVFFDRDNSYYYISSSPTSVFVPPPQNDPLGRDGQFDTNVFNAGLQLESPARVTGNNIISATPTVDDWFETAKLNYGFDLQRRIGFFEPRPRTWDLMVDVGNYWLTKGVDGFRVDFAHSVPIEFWRFFASRIRAVQPNAFLLAEAYETDDVMRLPGFSYEALLDAGFDTVFNSDLYQRLKRQSRSSSDIRLVAANSLPWARPEVVGKGYQFTQFVENHDEIRASSRDFSPRLGDSESRSKLGFAYTAFSALLPGHINIQGGQEVGEDASVLGPFSASDHECCRTSIFDFVYQEKVRDWLNDNASQATEALRDSYQRLLNLKHEPSFSARHSTRSPTYFDLTSANQYGDQVFWVLSYVRTVDGDPYLVVMNSDPFHSHSTTVHFTEADGQDSLGVLRAMGIENNNHRYVFEEVLTHPGFQPHDPAVSGDGLPGWVLYKQGNIPSGLFLGDIPPGSTMVFKLTAMAVE